METMGVNNQRRHSMVVQAKDKNAAAITSSRCAVMVAPKQTRRLLINRMTSHSWLELSLIN